MRLVIKPYVSPVREKYSNTEGSGPLQFLGCSLLPEHKTRFLSSMLFWHRLQLWL